MSSDRLGIGVFVVCQYQDIRSPAPRVYLLVCFSSYSFLCIFLKQCISQSIVRKALGFKTGLDSGSGARQRSTWAVRAWQSYGYSFLPIPVAGYSNSIWIKHAQESLLL